MYYLSRYGVLLSMRI